METTINTIEKVEVLYTIVDGDLTYMDTIVYDKDEYELKKDKLGKEYQDKFVKWKEYVNTPKVKRNG